jgi:hypothetical protein
MYFQLKKGQVLWLSFSSPHLPQNALKTTVKYPRAISRVSIEWIFNVSETAPASFVRDWCDGCPLYIYVVMSSGTRRTFKLATGQCSFIIT